MGIKRVAIVGGESTGKSELACALAHQYHTEWVPEYAREYLTHLNRNYELSDLTAIAKGQLELEQLILKKAKGLLFLDTTLDVIRVWSEFKYHTCDRFILNSLAKEDVDAYILTYPDIPWEPDPLREHPDEQTRERLYLQYLDIVIASNKPFLICRGSKTTRCSDAMNFINSLFQL